MTFRSPRTSFWNSALNKKGAFKMNLRIICLGLFDMWSTPFDGLSDIRIAHTDRKTGVVPSHEYPTDFSVESAITTPTTSATNNGGKQQKNSRTTSNKKASASSENKRQRHNSGDGFAFLESKQDSKRAVNGQSIATSAASGTLTLTGRNKKRVLCTTCKKSFCDKGKRIIIFY